MTMLPILMYHGLHATPADRGRFDAVYSVRPDDFARQLDWLLAEGYRSVLLRDADGEGARQIVITFDDGDVSNLEVAVPLLRERGMVADFFLTTGFLGQPGMLTTSDVRHLVERGMGVGSHGCSHAFLEDLDDTAVASELCESRNLLRALGGGEVTAIALPGGRGGHRERCMALSMGYRFLLGSFPGPNRVVAQGQWLQRLAVTRGLSLAEFGIRVKWQGLRPRMDQARFMALTVPKLMLGNEGYQRLRQRLL